MINSFVNCSYFLNRLLHENDILANQPNHHSPWASWASTTRNECKYIPWVFTDVLKEKGLQHNSDKFMLVLTSLNFSVISYINYWQVSEWNSHYMHQCSNKLDNNNKKHYKGTNICFFYSDLIIQSSVLI